MICPICTRTCGESEAALGNHEYWWCSLCGTAFLAANRINNVRYDGEYYAPWEQGEHGLELTRYCKSLTFQSWLSLLEKWCRPGRLLDVGCAMGFLLQVAVARGWQASGIEVSDYAARRAAADGRCVVHCGTLQDHPFQTGSFDVVSMFDVLEHLESPHLALQQVHALLKSRGFLILSTPNLDSWSSTLLGSRWPQRKPEHRFLFSRSSIRRLLHETGFQLVRIRPAWKWLTLEFLLSYARCYAPKTLAALFTCVYQSGIRCVGNLPFPVATGEMLVVAQRRA